MSKYENEHFANMKISIFLIIGFTYFVFCSADNSTDDSYPDVCPIKFFRQKRAVTEYTRWRANMESTPEFIVKVLDEELPPPQKTKRIIAVNIQPQTKGVEKIIVGGVMVTIPAQKSDSVAPEIVKDYTRFVPPTTVATRIEGDYYIAPIHTIQPLINYGKENLMPRAKHPQRDESPPAGPQFLPHSPRVAALRQYAPITPVGFTRRIMTMDRVPTRLMQTESVTQSSKPAVSRTTPFDEIFPTRTKFDMEEIDNLPAFDEETERHYATKTTLQQTSPERTFSIYQYTPTTTKLDFLITREKNDDYIEKKSDEKDFNAPYSIFENYEDEPGGKRTNKELIDIYGEKLNDEEKERKLEVHIAKDNDYAFKNTDIKDINYNRKDTENVIKDTYDIVKDTDTIVKDSSDFMKDTDYATKDFDITKTDVVQEMTEVINVSKMVTAQTKMTHQEVKKVTKTVKPTRRPVNYIPTNTPIQSGIHRNLKDVPHGKRHQECSLIKLREYNFNSPRTLPEIEAKLKHWAEDSPVAKWVDITDGNYTIMERPIYMMIVDDPSSGQVISAKQTVMIIAGIQGRDQHAVAAAMYVLYQLIERTEAHTDLLTKYRFWIIPVFNPDGYDYAMTFPHRREWVKNLRQNWDVCKGRSACHSCEVFGLRCTIQPCYGVNLDRNFEYQWIPAEELRTEHPCGALYAGTRQLSEIETNSFVKFLHAQHRPISSFIAFKEGEVLGVMYPYSHTKKKRTYDHIYKQRASRAAAAAYSISGRPYMAGQTSQFLPLYAGGIEDWVDGHLGVDNTYTIMMFRPTDSYNSNSFTERVVHEAYAAMDTLLLQSVDQPAGSDTQVNLVRAKESIAAETVSASTIILTFTIILHILHFT